MGTFKRIVMSRKVQTGLAGILGAVLVVWLEVDYTEQILTLITAVTSLLVGGQVALDHKHGSPSDGTDR